MNWNERRLALLLCAGLLAAAAACVPSARTSATSAAGAASANAGGGIHDIGDPCRLLDQVDAGKLFGHVANIGLSNFGSSSASCTYLSATPGDLLTLNVIYEDGPAKDSSDYNQVKTPDSQPVPGLGDDATFDNTSQLLTVAKGHFMFTLNASLGGPRQSLEPLKPLAQTVLARLPNS